MPSRLLFKNEHGFLDKLNDRGPTVIFVNNILEMAGLRRGLHRIVKRELDSGLKQPQATNTWKRENCRAEARDLRPNCVLAPSNKRLLYFTKWPDFAFRFFAVYMQRLLIFCRHFLSIDTTCFSLTGHHQAYRDLLPLWAQQHVHLMMAG
jgi:hypothetical protein